MKKVLFHGLWLSTSLLFFLSGIMCLIHPNGTIVTLAILLGFSLFLSGINDYESIYYSPNDSTCV